MTLHELIKQCPTNGFDNIQVWVEANPAYDFKGSGNTIFLISQPFGDSGAIEPLTLQEIINFSEELDYLAEDIIFKCEYELHELKTSEWHENKLTLYFS